MLSILKSQNQILFYILLFTVTPAPFYFERDMLYDVCHLKYKSEFCVVLSEDQRMESFLWMPGPIWDIPCNLEPLSYCSIVGYMVAIIYTLFYMTPLNAVC